MQGQAPAGIDWQVAGGAGEPGEAGGAAEVAPAAAPTGKAKRAQRHGFATQDQEKAQAAAKARLEKKAKQEDQNAAQADEGKLTVGLKRVDGKLLGLKYGPGLIVTSIQADSWSRIGIA